MGRGFAGVTRVSEEVTRAKREPSLWCHSRLALRRYGDKRCVNMADERCCLSSDCWADGRYYKSITVLFIQARCAMTLLKLPRLQPSGKDKIV